MSITRGRNSSLEFRSTNSIRSFFLACIFGLCLCLSTSAQSIEKTVKKGDPVTIVWELDTDTIPSNVALLYFRPRISQTPAGSYNVGPKIPATDRIYTFTSTQTVHMFLTAWYSVTVNGVTTTAESVGSNHLKITVTP